MTKMASIPIYGKNPLKSSPEPRPISTKLGMLCCRSRSIIICSNDDLGVILTYFTSRSIFFVAQAFLQKKHEKNRFSENISACDLKPYVI